MRRNVKVNYDRCLPGGMESDDDDDDDDDDYFENQNPSGIGHGLKTFGVTCNTGETSNDREINQPTAVSVTTVGLPLVPQKAHITEDYRMAVMNGNLSTVKSMIVDNGGPTEIQVHTIIKPGWTGLMYACSFGHPDVTEFLLQKGADANFHHEQLTPLMAACASSKNVEGNLLNCVHCLIRHGANVNASEKHQMTPLMFAVKNDRLKIIKLLLENEANLDMVDNQGWTALHWSVSAGHIDVVRMLLRANANVDVLEPNFAHDHGRETIAELLKEYVAAEKILEDAELSLNSKEKTDSSIDPKHKFSTFVYGDLEVFLSGLGLNDLIPVFHAHELKFKDVLQLTDADLMKIGIEKLGRRKSILDGTRMVHLKDWQESSLPNQKDKNFISCPDAFCMMANIEKHLSYIQATIVYLRQQLQDRPQILEAGQESKDVRALFKKTEDVLKANGELDCELRLLQRHLDQVQTHCEYVPADLIVDKQFECNTGSPSKLRKILGRPIVYAFVVILAAIVGVTACPKITKI